MLSKRIAARLGGATVLVDIANVRDDQLRILAKDHLVPAFVSTQKTFNYKASKELLPWAKAGTEWFVLRVPHRRDDGRVHHTAYDGHKFRSRPMRRNDSPHLRYHGDSKCSIGTRHGHATTPPAHSACEIDDLVIAQVAAATGLPVLTNDIPLRRAIETKPAPKPDRAMRALMQATELTVLVARGQSWRLIE